jgi:phosphatidylglycerophosphate synthase
VSIFTIWFEKVPDYPFILLCAAAVAGLFVVTFLRSAMVAEGGRQGWTRRFTGSHSKMVFTVLFIAWAVFFGTVLYLVPHEGANSPYGGIGLIAMFTGFFVMMGLIWSVVGE